MNIRIVRKKIKSVGNVKKITKAMQLVSAIKMKKAQILAIESAPYRNHLEKIIYKAVSTMGKSYSSLIENKTISKKNLYIVISSNKGLCGAFNFNIFRKLNKTIDFSNSDFITLGKKGATFISKMGGRILSDYSSGFSLNSVSPIFNETLKTYIEGRYEKVFLVYNRFINTLKFETVVNVLLPAHLDTSQTGDIKVSKEEYLIEPSPQKIVDSVLKSLVEEKIRGAVIESLASEHSSRMIAMKNATDNATDVIYNLTLLRNKIRQEKITSELLDMITAKESVEIKN